MPEFRLPYGKTHLTLTLPDNRPVELIAPGRIPPATDPARLTERALNEPMGDRGLDHWTGAKSVAIAIADKTRPISRTVLYPLLAKLADVGLPPESITFLIATGTHAPMQPEEFDKVLPPDILGRYSVFSHDCDDQSGLIYQGTTRRGTPVWGSRRFAEAHLRIVVGSIEPHQFMGFSGGVKTAAIGLAGRETINKNHIMMLDSKACLGHYEDNPARQDVEEIGQMMEAHFALNTILNADQQIVRVIAGQPVAVVRAGIPMVREFNEVPVAQPCDLIIASPGGYPKDINLYQAQKALAHASRITKDGGTVILVASCAEGIGSAGYETWVAGMQSHEDVLARFASEPFQLGPHKAFQIARDAVRVHVLLVSEMSTELAKRVMLTPAHDLDRAVATALDQLGAEARLGIMPFGNSTVPVLQRYRSG